MKRLLQLFLALALVGVIFSSCKKDDSSSSSNSVTITGEFTIGDKTYTNPTFDLGAPADHEGYLTTNVAKSLTYNKIYIENDIPLGNNVYLYYELNIYSATPGTGVEMNAYIEVYEDVPLKSSAIYIYSNNTVGTITSVGEVGGYIEGTYEGDFYNDKKVDAPYHVVGKFKVMRVEEPTK